MTDFDSIDRFGSSPDPAEKQSKGKKSKPSGKHESNQISPSLQEIIWNLPHSATQHFPGKLSLCIGMPVIIRNNNSTKLCITKGQEGHVVGWQAGKGPHGKNILDTIFIKLSPCFKRYFNGQTSFETARDTIRQELYSKIMHNFPMAPEAQVLLL